MARGSPAERPGWAASIGPVARPYRAWPIPGNNAGVERVEDTTPRQFSPLRHVLAVDAFVEGRQFEVEVKIGDDPGARPDGQRPPSVLRRECPFSARRVKDVEQGTRERETAWPLRTRRQAFRPLERSGR